MTRVQLKKMVLEANLLLSRERLALLTWGNASACDRQKGHVVIKPSGVPYPRMKPTDMSVVDFDGKQIEGRYRPSSDLETHLAIYRAFPSVGGVVHTHSTYATAWAQAGLDLPAEGTTHADHFRGAIPCTRALRPEEISGAYEAATGKVIVETFLERHIDPAEVAAVLVRNHGPFTWGSTVDDAAHNAVVLEEVARMALLSRQVGNPEAISRELLDKHFLRKHGPGAYYGQR